MTVTNAGDLVIRNGNCVVRSTAQAFKAGMAFPVSVPTAAPGQRP